MPKPSNPTAEPANLPKPQEQHLREQIEAMRPLAKVMGIFSPKIRKQFQEVEKHLGAMDILVENRAHFAKTYSPLGWVYHDRMSTEVVARALALQTEEGEAALADQYLDPEQLRFLGYRFHTQTYEPWQPIYERATERAVAGDYMSATSLALIIIDGICTTSTGKHPFSGGADAPVFDSQTMAAGGLAEGLALLGSTRRKLDTTPITVPFRHGIVHGLNPQFDNRLVAGKTFNLLHALVDYFDHRRDEETRIAKAAEEQKPVDLRELGRSLAKNREAKKALDAWTARPPVSGAIIATSGDRTSAPDPTTPEGATAIYLGHLTAKNFGELAKATIDYPKRTIGYRAGHLRTELQDITVTSWTVTGVEDTASAISVVTAKLEGKLHGEPWQGEQSLRMMYADDDYSPRFRGDEDGRWVVMPNFLSNLWVLAIKDSRKRD